MPDPLSGGNFGTLHVTGADTDDTFLVRALPADEGSLEVLVNGQSEYVGLRQSLTGGIQVDGLAGNDTLVVDFETSAGDPVAPGGIFFQGGIPEGGAGIGDALTILPAQLDVDFQAEPSDLDAGLFVVGDSAAISFDGVERIQLADSDYIRPDRFEVNNTVRTATVLGSEPAVTLRDLSIHSVGRGESDPDFYRVTASATGMLIVHAHFLHEMGDLDLFIRDSRGIFIASSESNTNNESLVIPVFAQESYWVQVLGDDGATNQYSLEVENFAVPIPQGLHLDVGSDTGMMSNDGITADSRPTFVVQADLAALRAQGIPMLTAEQARAGTFSGAAVLVRVADAENGEVFTDFAKPRVGNAELYDYDAPSLRSGSYVVSAAIQIFDPVQDLKNGMLVPQPVTGRTTFSPGIIVQVDATQPDVTSAQMLPSSDSGMDSNDRVTNLRQPAFLGAAEPNAKVRLLANGLMVGNAVAGSDGRWEITVEPLTDGIYGMTTIAEDVAGNFGESSVTSLIEIDRTPPNTPFLDLTAGSDTGTNDADNVTGDSTLTFTMTSTDPGSDHLTTFNLKYRIYVRPEGGTESLIYDSATDAEIPAVNKQGGFTDLNMLTATLPQLPEGEHNFKLEVEDRAGNISHDFLLPVTIDNTLPSPITIDLLPDSDTGMFDSDNVTHFSRPTLTGVGDLGGVVTLFAGERVVGSGVVGGDASDGQLGNGLGTWQITTGSLADGRYELTAVIENNVGSVRSESLTIEIDTRQPNTPSLDLLPNSDTGHSQSDNITREDLPAFHFATTDPNQGSHVSPFNYKYRLFLRSESGAEELVYDSSTDTSIAEAAIRDGFTSLENLTRTISRRLTDGVHNFKLEVEDRAGNISEDVLLNVTIDTSIDMADGGITLDLLNDTGMDDNDNVTKTNRPSFGGVGEVGAEISLYADGVLVGTSTVGSDDTDFQPGNGLGSWQVTSETLTDGPHQMLVHMEDWAGNFARTLLAVEIDTEPPNTPFLDLAIESDDGSSGTDNFTSRQDLTFDLATTDPNLADHANPFNYKYRLFLRSGQQGEQLVYASETDASLQDNLVGGFTDLEALRTTLNDLPRGTHNFKLEVEDRAGNISHDTILEVTIGTIVVDSEIAATTIQLVPSSDAGMSRTDSVTNINQPAFSGLGDAGGTVMLIANNTLVGVGIVGGDASDGVLGDGAGLWQVNAAELADGVYEISATVEDAAGNLASSETVTVEIDTLQPNTPLLDLVGSADSGHSATDNITSIRNPTFHMVTADPNAATHLDPFNFKYRLFVRFDNGREELVYDSVGDSTLPAASTDGVFTSLSNLTRTLAQELPAGTHNFKLEVEDRAGNISEDFLLNVTIDTSIDMADGGITLDLLNDTGMDDSDNVTKTNRPSFGGVGEVGAEISLYADGVLVGTSTVGSDDTDFQPGNGLGSWQVTSETLADGPHQMLVHIEDWAGNFARTLLAVEIDTEPPNTPFLDLVGGANAGPGLEVTSSSTLTFTMTTEDPDSSDRLDPFNYKYRLFLRPEGGAEQLVYTSVTDPNIPPENLSGGMTDLTFWQTTLSDLPEGEHNFKLEVEDRAGNVSEDFLLSVRIDQTPVDAPTIDLLSSSDTGMSDNDEVTSKDQPAFNGVGSIGAAVRLISNDAIVGTATVGGDASNGILGDGLGAWEITSEPLDDGIYTAIAQLEDDFGNVADTAPITFEIDSLQPNTPHLDLSPLSDSGLFASDDLTSETKLSFHMTTTDPNQNDHLIPFNYKYRLFVRPEAGSERLLYDSSEDPTLPESVLQNGFVNLEQLSRTIELLDIPDGVHNFKLEVEDRAGNISEDVLLNVTIDTSIARLGDGLIEIDLLDSSDTGMSDRDNVTNKDQPAISGVAEVGAMVMIFANGRPVGVGVVGSDETDFSSGDGLGAWEVTVEPLDDGVYSLLAHVEDLAGNFVRSQPLTMEVDTAAPNTPHLDLLNDTGHSSHDNITGETSLNFNLTTQDPDPAGGHLDEFNYKYRIYLRPEGGQETLVYDSVVDPNIEPESRSEGFTNLKQIQATLAPLPDGIHNFKLEVEDRAGNISHDFLLDVQIDSILAGTPEIDLIASSDTGMLGNDNVTNIHQPAFAGVAEAGSTVRLRANGQLIGVAEVQSDESDGIADDGLGQWEITSEPLTDGIYTVSAEVEDWAGNIQRTGDLTIQVDTRAPNTPFLDLATESDTGTDRQDEITRDNTLTFNMTTTDEAVGGHVSPQNYKFRLYLREENAAERLVYNSATDPLIEAANLQDGLTDLNFLQRTLDPLPAGAHNFKLEVEDRAGNISHDFLLNVLIDTVIQTPTIELVASSDSGMSAADRVTNQDQPTFSGTGEAGDQVSLYANGILVGTGFVGSDETDFFGGDGIGTWEITAETLDDGVYDFFVHIEDDAGNFQRIGPLQVQVDTLEPNTPHLDLLEADDSGRHNDDNITNAETVRFSATTHDPNALDHAVLVPGGQNFKYRLYLRPESGGETLIYDSSVDGPLDDALDGLIAATQIETPAFVLPEGLHNLKLEVEDRAGNISRDFLSDLLVDRTPFQGTIALDIAGDTGIWGIDSTFGDGVTGNATPTLVGTAEANNIVTLLVNDEVVASTVTKPFDGDDAFPLATWEIELTEPLADEEQTFTVVFEDPAGNRTEGLAADIAVDIVVDTVGPRIDNVTRTDASFTSLFTPKPAGGPDPLIGSIVVHFSDGPARPEDRLYGAVVPEVALEEGNYRLVGDANGNIPITHVTILGGTPGPGLATTAVQLDFAVPLPDDRFTLTVSDRIADAAGNPLDGESGAAAPFTGNNGLTPTEPIFPTGDGNHGGDFVARFTIDSRPEIGVWAGGSVYVDTNGNFIFDQDNLDFVNRDISYTVGFTSDDVFAGNFSDGSAPADGYDKLAAYGHIGGWAAGSFRWLIDINNDGVIDINVEDSADVNGIPIAGDFDGDALNGDEVALFDGRAWHFDTNHDFLVDVRLDSELRGYPVVGDLDRDGFDDLATWSDDTFMVDLAGGTQNGWDGVADVSFRFGFIGVRERPVAADMDQDGYEDLGLWVPDRGGMMPRESAEWYWLLSGGKSILDRVAPATDVVRGALTELDFRPIPFGDDIFAQFGDEFGIPIVGNFDPPSLETGNGPQRLFTNPLQRLDVSGDGFVTARDALIIINHINEYGSTSIDEVDAKTPFFLDTTRDGHVSPLDVLSIINYLNDPLPLAEESDPLDLVAFDVAQALAAGDTDEDDDPMF